MRIAKSGPVLFLLVLYGCLFGTNLFAADALVAFFTEQQADHYQALLKRYRCLKCQNQNLADSAAELAQDLSRKIAQQVVAGKSTSDIDDYLVQRYGEFVLYKPRFKASTLMLGSPKLFA